MGAYYLLYKGPQRTAAATKDGAIDAANQSYDLARRFGADVRAALGSQPGIVVGNVTVLEGCSSRSDYVAAESSFSHTTEWEQTWMMSTLHLKLKGRFRALAGFPLDGSFQISLDENQKVVRVRHAPARILSCELTQVEFVREDGGYFNWVKPADREAAQNALLKEARAAATHSDLLIKATENLTEQLDRLAARYSFRLEHQRPPKEICG